MQPKDTGFTGVTGKRLLKHLGAPETAAPRARARNAHAHSELAPPNPGLSSLGPENYACAEAFRVHLLGRRLSPRLRSAAVPGAESGSH
jgi:hypothetical protein